MDNFNILIQSWSQAHKTPALYIGTLYLAFTRVHVNLGLLGCKIIQIRIFDPRSHGSWCIKGTDESLPRVDSSVPLIHHDPSDLGSKVRIRIFPKKLTLKPRLHKLFLYGNCMWQFLFARVDGSTNICC